MLVSALKGPASLVLLVNTIHHLSGRSNIHARSPANLVAPLPASHLEGSFQSRHLVSTFSGSGIQCTFGIVAFNLPFFALFKNPVVPLPWHHRKRLVDFISSSRNSVAAVFNVFLWARQLDLSFTHHRPRNQARRALGCLLRSGAPNPPFNSDPTGTGRFNVSCS